jgi:hypothetical protein
MTEELQPPEDYQAGESLRQEVSVTEEGQAKTLAGSDIEWFLLVGQGSDEADALLSTAQDPGVSIDPQDLGGGRFDIVISKGATDNLGGRRAWQRLEIDDNVTGLQYWGSAFPIEER